MTIKLNDRVNEKQYLQLLRHLAISLGAFLLYVSYERFLSNVPHTDLVGTLQDFCYGG